MKLTGSAPLDLFITVRAFSDSLHRIVRPFLPWCDSIGYSGPRVLVQIEAPDITHSRGAIVDNCSLLRA